MNKIVKATVGIVAFYSVVSFFMIIVTELVFANPSEVGRLGLSYGKWWAVLTSTFVHISYTHLGDDLKGVWSPAIAFVIVCATGMHVYEFPSFKYSVAIFDLTPFFAALAGNGIYYTLLVPSNFISVGASGLVYAMFGTALVVSVFYLRMAARVLYTFPKRSEFARGRAQSIVLYSFVINAMASLAILGNIVNQLWDPTVFFVIQPLVGYQIHILGFTVGILGGAFFIFGARVDRAHIRVRDLLIEHKAQMNQ